MEKAGDWNDLQLRLISAFFLIFISAFCIYLGNHFYIIYCTARWSNTLGIGQNAVTIVRTSYVVQCYNINDSYICPS